MTLEVLQGIILPFVGTTLGAAMVFVLKGELSINVRKILTGFAAGVMVSASFFGLLQPALESSADWGNFSFVTLHNIPEGMAVGVIYAGFLANTAGVTETSALALAVGIAIQNFPEGAIVSMPLRAEGLPKLQTFFYGTLSGAVEPIAAVVTIYAATAVVPFLPYLLAFAAGAMIYVVVEELIPEMSEGSHSNAGTIAFAFGFVLMMILDVALG